LAHGADTRKPKKISMDPKLYLYTVEVRLLVKMTTNARLQDTIWEWAGIEAMLGEGNSLCTLNLSLLGHSLPLGRGALQAHLTGSNFPMNVMVLYFT